MRLLKRIFLVLILATVALLIVAQVVSNFFLKSVLEREARRIFQVPVSIEQAGANLFGGSFWMKGVRIGNLQGFQQADLMTARTIAIDFNLLSFLTSEFALCGSGGGSVSEILLEGAQAHSLNHQIHGRKIFRKKWNGRVH